MTSTVESGYRAALGLQHRQLQDHFIALRQQRNELAPGTPVFALEHGLTDEELALMRSAVVSAVRRGDLPRDLGLPFVVYAAEIGYEYSGDEYWQTFEDRTPGWWQLGDRARQYVRSQYRRFRDNLGGATPTGAWAQHFSIICWPITHAVLPTDLQRQLARLLYDFSRVLTADLLENPDELGRRLAGRAWLASARLQAFAQNSNLLGQVAAALLAGEDGEPSPFLLGSTLMRIVNDLSKESEARRWLLDAKYRANKVRTHGFQPAGLYRSSVGRQREERPVVTDPALTVRTGADGWSLFLEMPDLASLAERLPELGEEMARLRPVIQGVSRRFGSGQLMHPGLTVRVSRWPRADQPLIQLERGSALANQMLRDHCGVSPGPNWLFRLRELGFGSEVRGKFVRPDHRYLLVTTDPLMAVPAWATPTSLATEGVHGYVLTVPVELDVASLNAIKEFGVVAVMDVEVRPVGVVPAAWDGEGTAEWIEGDAAIIAIRSSRSATHCLISLDDQPAVLAWPADSQELLVHLTDLRPGRHQVSVSLTSEDANAPVASGRLEVIIRPPRLTTTTGTPREGLMLLASPASPTLDEIWDGHASVQLLGPAGIRVTAAIALADRRGQPLMSRKLTLPLPLDSSQWAHTVATQLRRREEMHNVYERAETCIITASSPELGCVSLRCDRAFAPLRWAFGRDRDGPFVYLVDNTDGVTVTAATYDFAHPGARADLPLEPGQRVRQERGGLVVAQAGSTRASLILPPHVRTLADLGTEPPRLPAVARVVADILRMIEVADLWGRAALPADPVGAVRRTIVLRAFAAGLTGVVAGRRWTRAELLYAERSDRDPRALRAAIGNEVAYQQQLASALVGELTTIAQLDIADRVLAFAQLLEQHARAVGVHGIDRPFAEFLLRFVSEPGALCGWPPAEREALLERALDSPLLVRAARFVVLTTAADEDTGTTYPGWTWE
jgi:hypothetical protein